MTIKTSLPLIGLVILLICLFIKYIFPAIIKTIQFKEEKKIEMIKDTLTKVLEANHNVYSSMMEELKEIKKSLQEISLKMKNTLVLICILLCISCQDSVTIQKFSSAKIENQTNEKVVEVKNNTIINQGRDLQVKNNVKEHDPEKMESKGCVPPCKGKEYCEGGKCVSIAMEEKKEEPKLGKENKMIPYIPHSGTIYTFMNKTGELSREQLETLRTHYFNY